MLAREPFRLPTGVRTASTITASRSDMQTSWHKQFTDSGYQPSGRAATPGRSGHGSGGEGVDPLRYDPDDHAGELVGFGRRVLAEVLLRQRPGQGLAGVPAQFGGAAELHRLVRVREVEH